MTDSTDCQHQFRFLRQERKHDPDTGEPLIVDIFYCVHCVGRQEQAATGTPYDPKQETPSFKGALGSARFV